MIIWVDYKYYSIRILVVVIPKESNFLLSTHVPYSEIDIFVLNTLDIESDGWNSSNHLVKLKFVEYCRLSRSV